MTMPPPCYYYTDRPAHKQTVVGCLWCNLYVTNEKVRKHWDRSPNKGKPFTKADSKPPRINLNVLPGKPDACKNLGALVRKVGCGTCPGNTTLHVFACSVYGECTISTPHASAAGCCDGGKCPGYSGEPTTPVQ